MVAWHLTGSSVDGEDFMEETVQVIVQCKEIGILICFLTNDMGSENKSVWKILCIGKIVLDYNFEIYTCHTMRSRTIKYFPRIL